MMKRLTYSILVLLTIAVSAVYYKRPELNNPSLDPTQRQALRDAPGPIGLREKSDDQFTQGLIDVQNSITGNASPSNIAVVKSKVMHPSSGSPAQVPKPVDALLAAAPTRWLPDYSHEESPPPSFPDEAMKKETMARLLPAKLVIKYENEYSRMQNPDRAYEDNSLHVPASKLKEVRRMVRAVESAGSYEDAIDLWRQYLYSIGMIQHFKTLKLIHCSVVGPNVILKDGILSTDRVSAIAPNTILVLARPFGNGIYFFGTPKAGWPSNPYHKYKYGVELADMNILMLTPPTEDFINLFASIRSFWGKDTGKAWRLDVQDVPADLVAYLKIDGTMDASPERATPEINILRDAIDPSRITYLGRSTRP